MWRVSITCCLLLLNLSVQRLFLYMFDSTCERQSKAGWTNGASPERGLYWTGGVIHTKQYSRERKAKSGEAQCVHHQGKQGVDSQEWEEERPDDRKGQELIRKVRKKWEGPGHFPWVGLGFSKLIFNSIKSHFQAIQAFMIHILSNHSRLLALSTTAKQDL